MLFERLPEITQLHFSIASSGFPLELWLMINPLFQRGQLNEMMPF